MKITFRTCFMTLFNSVVSRPPDEDTNVAFVEYNSIEGYCVLDVPGKENAAAGPIFVRENAAIYSLFNNCIFILSCPYNIASLSSCVGFDFAPHYMAIPLNFCRLNCLVSVRP